MCILLVAVCPDAPQKSCSGTQATQAESVCNKIMDPAFQACHTVSNTKITKKSGKMHN